MKRAEILSHTISYRDIGQGPVVVLLHGYGGSTSDWNAVSDRLSKEFRVITPNLSSLFLDPHRPMSFSQQVIILKEFLHIFKKSKNDNVFVAGSSYGAALAYALTVEAADYVDRLALLNPMPPSPYDFVKNPLLKVLLKVGRFAPAIALLLMSPAGKLGLPYIQNIFNVTWLQSRVRKNRMISLNSKKIKMITHVIHRFTWINDTEDWSIWRARIGFVKIPVHVLYGGRDTLFTPDTYSQLAKVFPQSDLSKIPHGGHLISRECADEVSEILSEFFKASPQKLALVKEIN